jgi:hypothetical protein
MSCCGKNRARVQSQLHQTPRTQPRRPAAIAPTAATGVTTAPDHRPIAAIAAARVTSAPSTNLQRVPNPVRSAAGVTTVTTLLTEYRGAGRAAVRGPITGNTYVFSGPGARVMIDIRDKDLERTVRGLKVLQS